jgi:hypothetical protein
MRPDGAKILKIRIKAERGQNKERRKESINKMKSLIAIHLFNILLIATMVGNSRGKLAERVDKVVSKINDGHHDL